MTQENLKNKPKIGNLTEKTNPTCVGKKIQQNEKSTREDYIKKQEGKSEKASPKWANFHKNMPNMPLAVSWNSKSAIKFNKNAIRKTEICKKQANFD